MYFTKNQNEEQKNGTLNSYDFERGVIRVYDDINFKMVKEISEFVWSYMDVPPIEVSANGNVTKRGLVVEIMSQGGCLKSGLAIYDILNRVKSTYHQLGEGIPLTTIGIGFVASSATVIFSSGTQRLAYPHTEFLMHQPALTNIGGTGEQIAQQSVYLQLVEDQMINIYSKVTKKSLSKIKRDILNKDLILTSQEAKDYGLVTALI